MIIRKVITPKNTYELGSKVKQLGVVEEIKENIQGEYVEIRFKYAKIIVRDYIELLFVNKSLNNEIIKANEQADFIRRRL